MRIEAAVSNKYGFIGYRITQGNVTMLTTEEQFPRFVSGKSFTPKIDETINYLDVSLNYIQRKLSDVTSDTTNKFLTEKEYVEKDGLVCPVCGGRDLDPLIADSYIEATLVLVPITCENCSSTWEDVYELTRYTKLVRH